MSSLKAQLETTKKEWNDFADTYTTCFSGLISMQAATVLHDQLLLKQAKNIIEVGGGGGVQAVDILSKCIPETTSFTMLDLSERMIELALENETLTEKRKQLVESTIEVGNAMDLNTIPTASKDRYISNLCLQLVPDADAMIREASRVLQINGIAGFTIWGSPENSGFFSIWNQAHERVRKGKGLPLMKHFDIGKDIIQLKQRFEKAGFTQVRIWPMQCIVEMWKVESYVEMMMNGREDDEESMDDLKRNELREATLEIGRKWLEQDGKPIALEEYLIVAKRGVL